MYLFLRANQLKARHMQVQTNRPFQTRRGPLCESMPAESTAHVKAVDQVTTDADANATSVFENMPRKSQASITHSDTLQGLSEGPSVFESQPSDRITDAAHNVERGESDSEWTTDSEA